MSVSLFPKAEELIKKPDDIYGKIKKQMVVGDVTDAWLSLAWEKR